MKIRMISKMLACMLSCTVFSGLMSGCRVSKNKVKVVPLTYPSDTVTTIDKLQLDEGDYIRKGRGAASYTGNGGKPYPTLVISPYYSLTVNGEEVPVYATVVYVGTDGECALHSFAIIDAEIPENASIDVTLQALRYPLKQAIIRPESLGVTPSVNGDTVSAAITAHGDYTFLMNDEDSDVSQYNAFTLFVRKYRDEEAEIRAYQKQYGEENVHVWEPGTYEIDYINVENSNQVYYFKRGSLLIARGNPDYGENYSYEEDGAAENNGWGLERYPIFNAYQKMGIVIAGQGTIDAGQLGWHERRGVLLSSCSECTVTGLTLINMPEWSLSTYCSTDINISNVAVFGYKTNSDGIAICNTINASVENCYARSGDDLFEVKTLGAPSDAVSQNITFTNCIAWGSKARCFGITGETNKDISKVVFRSSAVIFSDATWNNNILGSLVVISGTGNTLIDDILFENIEIYQNAGRPINLFIESEEAKRTQITNIVFRNITYSGGILSQVNTRSQGNNLIEVCFDKVVGNGVEWTSDNITDFLEQDEQSRITFAGKE